MAEVTRETIAAWRSQAAGAKRNAISEIRSATEVVKEAQKKIAAANLLLDRAEKAEQRLNASSVKLWDVAPSSLATMPRSSALPRARCRGRCGKPRYATESDAQQSTGTGDGTRVYFSQTCRCWHITKQDQAAAS